MNEVWPSCGNSRGPSVAALRGQTPAAGRADITAAGGELGRAFANAPVLTGMGSGVHGQTNNSYYQPTIHSLGASASGSPMLIEGHGRPAVARAAWA